MLRKKTYRKNRDERRPREDVQILSLSQMCSQKFFKAEKKNENMLAVPYIRPSTAQMNPKSTASGHSRSNGSDAWHLVKINRRLEERARRFEGCAH